MTNYDGYTFDGPTLTTPFVGLDTVVEEPLTQIISLTTPFVGLDTIVEEPLTQLISLTTPFVGLDSSIEEPQATIVNLDTYIIGQSQSVDEDLVNSTFINIDKKINKVPYYYLRASDSGLSSPGYIYWSSYLVDYTDAPTPTGSYSNILVLEIKPISVLASS